MTTVLTFKNPKKITDQNTAVSHLYPEPLKPLKLARDPHQSICDLYWTYNLLSFEIINIE